MIKRSVAYMNRRLLQDVVTFPFFFSSFHIFSVDRLIYMAIMLGESNTVENMSRGPGYSFFLATVW